MVRWALPIIGGVVALGFVFWLYRDLDFGQFLAALGEASPGWIAVLGAVILVEQVLNGWKWRQILHDVKPVRTLRPTGAFLAGYGANALVPLGISPLVRSWLIARFEGPKMGTVLTTTIIARFVDGVVFALFAGLVAVAGRLPRVEGSLELGFVVAGALNLALFGGLLWAMFRFRALFSEDGPLLCRLFDRCAGWFQANGATLRKSLWGWLGDGAGKLATLGTDATRNMAQRVSRARARYPFGHAKTEGAEAEAWQLFPRLPGAAQNGGKGACGVDPGSPDRRRVHPRCVKELAQAMGFSGISESTVSKQCEDIDALVGEFLNRRLAGEWP